MMFDLLTTSALLGGKKVALWSFFIGMTAAKAGTVTVDMIKIWGPFLAAITAAIYMGGLFEQVKDFQTDANTAHEQLEERFDNELLHLQKINEEKWHFREYKINKAFNAINEGGRWTLPMAMKANKEIMEVVSENSKEDNVRHATLSDAIISLSQRVTRIFERMDKIEGAK